MNANRIEVLAVIALSLTVARVARAQTTNRWTDGSGKWETQTNWSAGFAPSTSDALDLITNAGNNTVTIDATTSGSHPSTMSINNLTISGPSSSVNTLSLNNAGSTTPLAVANDLFVGAGGNVVLNNSTIQLNGGSGTFEVGGTISIQSGGVLAAPAPDVGSDRLSSSGAVWVTGGTLIVTNGTTYVAGYNTGINGQLTLSNGLVQAGELSVGGRGFSTTSFGTLSIAGGTMTVAGDIDVGPGRAGGGTIFVTGGQLIATNGNINLGSRAFGSLTISNGSILGQGMLIATGLGSHGILTIAGGTVQLTSNITMAAVNNGGNATIWVTGGQLIATNAAPYGVLSIGVGGALEGATARVIVSNGTVTAREIFLGSQTFPGDGSVGTLTVAGGTVAILAGTNGLVVGTGLGATGLVEVISGQLLFGSAPLVLGNTGTGFMTLSNGTATAASTTIGAGSNAQGRLTMLSGSTMSILGNFIAGAGTGSTATVSVAGGNLVVTNGTMGIGNNGTVTSGNGTGTMTVSATVLGSSILMGSSVGGRGQLTVQTNGLVNLVGTNAQLVANDLTVDGGDVEILNGQIYCGKLHPGAMTMSDGTANSRITYVGYDSQGTLTMVAGQMTVSSLLEIGFAAGSAGSVWMSGGQLTANALATTIGNQGVGQMSISNGIVTMADVFVGNSSNPGTLTLAGGTLTVNSLVLLNPTSQFLFSGGWLNALGITNSNGQTLTLGNGVSPTTLNLLGGISSLGNGLEISANATLTGCGTVNGNVTIDSGGTVLANCGTLTFTGSLINNGTMRANGGSVLENSGTVVNNGTIDIINGATNFHGVFINNGTVLTASGVKISQVSQSGQDFVVQIPSVTGHTYQLQYTTSLTPANWTFVASKPGTGGVLTFTDTGGAANPQRFYRVEVTAP